MPNRSRRSCDAAYESQIDRYARVTFDRNIRVRPTAGWDLFPDEAGWCRFDEYWRVGLPTHPVVLELKCETAAIPEWMTEVIRSNELTQTSFSKYSTGTCLTQWQQGRDVRSARSMGALAERSTFRRVGLRRPGDWFVAAPFVSLLAAFVLVSPCLRSTSGPTSD